MRRLRKYEHVIGRNPRTKDTPSARLVRSSGAQEIGVRSKTMNRPTCVENICNEKIQ